MSEDVVYIRTSERKLWGQCRQAWWWAYVERLRSRQSRPALRFGDLVHRALDPWYTPGTKRGEHPALTFRRLFEEQLEEGYSEFHIRQDDDEGWIDALSLGVDMLEHYVEHWGNDERLRVIAPEFAFQAPMTDARGKPLTAIDVDGKRKRVVYVGQFDIVVEDMETGQKGLIETKTAATIATVHLPIDEQAGSYWAFAPQVLNDIGALSEDEDLDFIMYNFLRKAKRDARPKNAKGQFLNKPTKTALQEKAKELGIAYKANTKIDELAAILTNAGVDVALLGEPSKSQPPPYFVRQRIYRTADSRENLLQRVRMQAWEMSLSRQGKLPVYKNPSGSYPDVHCNGCEFRDMCELHENGKEWEELRDMTMTTWDPYEAHNDSDAEDL